MFSTTKPNELDQAATFFEEGNYKKALPLLLKMKNSQTRSERVFHMLAVILYEQGKFKPSIDCFTKALEINPKFTDSSIGLSVVLNDLGKYEEAQKVFLKAQELLKEPEQKANTHCFHKIAQKHLELCHLYQEANQPQNALQELKNYELHAGRSESVVYEEFKIFKNLKQFDSAIKSLKSWIELQESPSPNVTFQLAEVYYLNKQPLAALTVCEKVLKDHPEHTATLNFYAKLKGTTFDLRTGEALP